MHFEKETVIRASRERVFAFHERPDAIHRLIPPWEDAEVIQKAEISQIEAQFLCRLKQQPATNYGKFEQNKFGGYKL